MTPLPGLLIIIERSGRRGAPVADNQFDDVSQPFVGSEHPSILNQLQS